MVHPEWLADRVSIIVRKGEREKNERKFPNFNKYFVTFVILMMLEFIETKLRLTTSCE